MPKVRVYELSKEIGVSNKDIINAAKQFGLELRSHASALEEVDAEKIKKEIQKSGVVINKSNDEEVVDKDVKEKVKVFKSESGQEVVERRTGAKVVLRKKKKAKDVEVETPPEPEVDKEQKTKEIIEDTPSEKLPDLEEDLKETEPNLDLDQHATDSEETSPAIEEGEAVLLDKEKTDEVIDDKEVKPVDVAIPVDAEEDKKEKDKKQKKKGKKVKPKREEIIDEDSLEELRKAFRTKLPSRKKEYIVEDRKFRGKSQGDNFRKYNKPSQNDARPSMLSNEAQTTSSTETLPNSQQQADVQPTKKTLKIAESITVGDLAKKMGVKATELIKKLIILGTPATINQKIDYETAIILGEEFRWTFEVEKYEEDEFLLEDDDRDKGELLSRPPVVTVMGHVDHGKTTLLDTIRETSVVEGEAGGITQHIGAYKVIKDDKTIVFVDTPGHEAFTSMRARGASITDIVILVVAADDGVMPQTIEAINHAKAAEVPIIVAINKIDKEDADSDKIKRELSEHSLITEEWGGDTLAAEVSAKSGQGINDLLELILLQSEVLELKAVADMRANGVILEAELDKGRGPVATVIITEGTLKIGDYVVAGVHSGRVRALLDENGNRVTIAEPSIPVEIMGLSGVPTAGERFYVVKDEKIAKDVISHREDQIRSSIPSATNKVSLDNLFETLEKEEIKELFLIVKADTQGSAEAIIDSVNKLSNEKCKVSFVHSGVGAINETDISLASASNAIVVGFNVRPDAKTAKLAEKEGVSLELHSIIYDVVNRIKSAMEGILEPIINEVVVGHADVKETFHISKVGTIAGCLITDGKANRDNNIRVLREGVIVYDGKVDSLRRFKDDVKEVQTGYECGIVVENFNDVKVGDVLELYTFEEIKQEL